MTRKDLIKTIHDDSKYNYSEIEDMMYLIFNKIIEGLKKEDKVLITGFGSFEKYYQDGYVGTNPKTGEVIKIDGNYKIRFNACNGLKDTINKK